MNRIIIIGNLTSDPENSVSSSGMALSKFTVAVPRKFKKEGERDADFFNVVTFNKIAENCANYLTKGKKVAVTGAVQFSDYADKDGNKRQYTRIVSDEVEFLSPRGETVQTAPKKADVLIEVNDRSLPF